MPGIYIGNYINKSLRGSWTPLSIVSKVLFWGKVSEISGGQMPNKITGASDFLTVAGSPYTFQTPNTAPYIAADTDYIWFKTNAAQRTTTTAELIGYDLQRTPVKYGNVSPNTLTEIVILKAGETLTADEVNSLHAYMHLSMFWSGVENDYGYLKDNRVGQQLWTPESAFFNAEAEALVNRMIAAEEEPDATRKTLIDTTFTAAKSKAFYAKFDAFWLLAAHADASSRMNWKENDHNITLISTPVFAADRGWSLNIVAGRALKTDFIPSTDGSNFLRNSASMGYYSRTENNAAVYNMGAKSGAVYTIVSNYLNSEVKSAINAASASQFAGPASTTPGMIIATRTSSTSVTNYKGTTGSTSGVNNSTGDIVHEIYIGGYNADGSLSSGKVSQISFAFIGGALDAQDVADINEVFVDGYLATIGAKI